MIGLYSPGSSFIHRAPTLLKLFLLSLCVVVIGTSPDLRIVGGAAAGVVLLFVIARVPVRAAVGQIIPILFILLIAVPIQGLLSGWLVAALMAGRLLVAVALAALFTMTTTVTAVLEAFQTLLRPFRRFVDPDRVGLLVALTIRCIPLVSDIVREVLEARTARGTQWSLMSIAVPVVVRSLYAADALGEALIARGLDD
ncbi:energy-coupling factor transporter transmembrane protein EcfT [Cryobacterium sp. TMS1-20-1]|uniref:energy-coupling factor transporter transmembrane component T family protein n=1 Tax=unclassified Cryobacterium TaxID=2649013 RepID=UPI00106B5DDC|nr:MULTISPECIES: energy-coupling factor transporter transmembrane protein EcfT [unclassified Cryobacterium]TFC78228.1 energy-coupling factor transporter transmembrane protein EcfT [Cryobacterium sp. TMS1-20-1]TFD53260.1 energy-coupling factor transporter transmembrane protein EcfT [Cryobacterium sp. Hh11]